MIGALTPLADATPGKRAARDQVGALAPARSLTPLGFHLARLPVDARIGKMLVSAAIMGCLEPALTIAALLAHKSPFINRKPGGKGADTPDRRRDKYGDLHSDHLAIADFFAKWESVRQQDPKEAAALARNYEASQPCLFTLADLRAQLRREMVQAGFSPSDGTGSKLLAGCVVAGLYPNAAQVQKVSTKHGTQAYGVTLQGHRCVPFPTSLVNPLRHARASHSWIMYGSEAQTSQLFLHDGTLVGPIALILFGGPINLVRRGQSQTMLEMRGVKFETGKEEVAVLLKLVRDEFDQIFMRRVQEPAAAPTELEIQVLKALQTLLELEEQEALR